MDFPVQDHAEVQERIFLDLEIGRKRVLVPAKEYARSDRLDVHGRGFDHAAVFKGVFNDFFVEHFVFAPAGDCEKPVEIIRKGGDMEITPDLLGGVAVLLAGFEIFADLNCKSWIVSWDMTSILIKPIDECNKSQ